MNFAGRDYFEKCFMFAEGGKLYKFSSSIFETNDAGERVMSTHRPLASKDLIRGEVLINVTVIERDTEGKIVMTTVTQVNLQSQVPKIIMNSFIPKAMKSWYDNVTKHYNKAHKRL